MACRTSSLGSRPMSSERKSAWSPSMIGFSLTLMMCDRFYHYWKAVMQSLVSSRNSSMRSSLAWRLVLLSSFFKLRVRIVGRSTSMPKTRENGGILVGVFVVVRLSYSTLGSSWIQLPFTPIKTLSQPFFEGPFGDLQLAVGLRVSYRLIEHLDVVVRG